ncbi:predicted protein [Botrytis cinerea T4]|uniref:Uncharacterized protein n=1 Tax=Botryotinia fuckeliana (strain T4) TaxID=999810 RepID=G2Y5L7_BOTF4|nr:predicted protein [Botrytis cinerea T4]
MDTITSVLETFETTSIRQRFRVGEVFSFAVYGYSSEETKQKDLQGLESVSCRARKESIKPPSVPRRRQSFFWFQAKRWKGNTKFSMWMHEQHPHRSTLIQHLTALCSLEINSPHSRGN